MQPEPVLQPQIGKMCWLNKKNRDIDPDFSYHELNNTAFEFGGPDRSNTMSKAANARRRRTILRTELLASSVPSADNGDADDAIRRAFGAVRNWRTPPNWSRRDWHREARAIIAAAGCRADLDYDPKRGVPRAAFVYKCAVASVWTRYRQEWAYALRFAAAPPMIAEQPASMPRWPNDSDRAMDRLLRDALNQLPSMDQWLIQQLFWNRKTEDQLAAALRISQQAVSKRKGRVLKRLRRTCNPVTLSEFVSSPLAFLGSLGLLPAADLFGLG
jgi:DNA-directed RNA polymerase specialized sigma24 family protein